jgi:formate dehydrogenase major subunit
VRVQSHHGEVLLPVRVSRQVKAGECFAGFHDRLVMFNRLTSPHRNRYVKAPEYQRTGVRITPA